MSMARALRVLIEDLTMSRIPLLEERSWAEIGEDFPAKELVLLPVGATEQHGPHLPVNTDSVIARALTWYAGAVTGIPVLPALEYTVSSGHTSKWPGTFSLTHERFIGTVSDIADWACRTGWQRLLIVNAHFGNTASLGVAIERIRLDLLGKLQVGAVHSFTLTEEILAAFKEDADDLHANKGETDLMLYLRPDLVRMDRVEDDPDRTAGTYLSHPVSQTSLNGVTGKPSLGNAADGEALFKKMAEALAGIVEASRHELPPLENEHWEGKHE